MNVFLVKLNRFCAWALLILLILYVVTGYGITKGIIDPALSKYLHDKLLAIPFFIFFVLHVGISGSYALIRWRVFKNLTSAQVFAAIFCLVMLAVFLWLYFL